MSQERLAYQEELSAKIPVVDNVTALKSNPQAIFLSREQQAVLFPPNLRVTRITPSAIEEAYTRLGSNICRILDRDSAAFLTMRSPGANTRSIYAVTEGGNRGLQHGFAKIDAIEKVKRNREQEIKNTKLLSKLGFPTLPILAFGESDRISALEYEYLDHRKYVLAMNDYDVIADMPPWCGASAATELVERTGMELPMEMHNEFPPSDDRVSSAKDFQGYFTNFFEEFLQNRHTQFLESVIGRGSFRSIYESRMRNVFSFVDTGENKGPSIFLDDVAPGNFAFAREDVNEHKDKNTIFLDLELVMQTPNPHAAKVADIGTCLARFGPNHAAQELFLQAAWKKDPMQDSDISHQLLEGAILFGTLFIAKFYLDPSHERHRVAKNLLQRLPKNLELLDNLKRKRQ